MTSLRPLLEHLIDYAGLFPPSSVPMARAVENYQRYRTSPEAWMLARFVVPVARLDEMEATAGAADIPISALIGGDLETDLARIARSPLHIDTIEMKAADEAQIEAAMGRVPAQLTAYIEVNDVSLIPVIRDTGARAKIRTGGVTPDAFPAASQIASFIETCARHYTPFKATAGLHHPLRCFAPLTYSSDGPSGWMFGFLNVFLAAALARKGYLPLEPVLLSENLALHDIEETDLLETRREFAISFGSCSFEEPVNDLRALNLI
jgi:hypothetical protein